MTKEELIQLIKEGKATLLDTTGKDVSKDLESPGEKEVTMGKKVDFSRLKAFVDKNEHPDEPTV